MAAERHAVSDGQTHNRFNVCNLGCDQEMFHPGPVNYYRLDVPLSITATEGRNYKPQYCKQGVLNAKK